MKLKKWVYSVPHSRSSSPFLTVSAGFFLQPPSPCSLAQTRFILSYALLLFRVLPSPVCPESEDSRRLPCGSRSLLATSAIRVLCPEPFSPAQCLATLDVSHVLDGLLRVWLCGLISSHCHVQGSLFRGLTPRPQLLALSHQLYLLVVRPNSATAVAHRSTSSVRALKALLRVRIRNPITGG